MEYLMENLGLVLFNPLPAHKKRVNLYCKTHAWEKMWNLGILFPEIWILEVNLCGFEG